MRLDWSISIGQIVIVGIVLPVLFALVKLQITIRDSIIWMKMIMNEYRPHDHGGSHEELRRSDIRFPKDF